MATDVEILSALNDVLKGIRAALNASGASKLLTLDRTTSADAALVYLRENGDERFRWGMPGGEDDFVIQHSPDGSPLTYADVLRIDGDTGLVTVTGLAIDAPSFNNASFTGQSLFAGGSAVAPSIANVGDTNTGLFFPAGGVVAGAADGEEIFRISPLGFAIGASVSSVYKLVVGGNVLAGDGADHTPDGSWTGQLTINGNGYKAGLAADASGLWVGTNSASRDVIMAVNETEVGRFTPTGLALGKSAASYLLDIAGAARLEVMNLVGPAPVINFADTDDGVTGQIGSGTSDFNIASNVSIDIRPNNVRAGFISNSGWQFFANETEVARFTSAGLAIGKSVANYPLDVEGDAAVNGNILLGRAAIVRSASDFARGNVIISAPNYGTTRQVSYGNNFYIDEAGAYQQDSLLIGGAMLLMSASNGGFGEFWFVAKEDPDAGGAEAVRAKIDGSGRLIIGGETGAYLLDVYGDIRARDALKVGTGVGTAYGNDNLIRPASSSAFLNIKGGAGFAKILLGNDDTAICSGAGEIVFRYGAGANDGGTEAMRIDSAGRVGIGTALPIYPLDVVGALACTSPGTASVIAHSGDETNYSAVRFRQTSSESRIEAFQAGTGTATPLTFVMASGEALRITEAGEVRIGQSATSFPGIGNTIAGAALTAAATLVLSRDDGAGFFLNRNGSDGSIAGFYRQGTQVGTISVTGTATSYNTSSGRHLKGQITAFEADSGAMIDALKPRSFTWLMTGERAHGFIADEFAAVFPRAVQHDDQGRAASIDASTPEVMATVVVELQSLRARVAQLEALR